MIYKLHKNKRNNILTASTGYYTEEYAQDMALAYDVQCPDCKSTLKQVGRQMTFNKLGLYKCPRCGK